MLKPVDLVVGQYPVALKPSLGYEQQLYVSTQAYTNPGTIEVVAPNSGTYSPSVADNAQLAAVPQELLIMLNHDVDLGGLPLTVTVNGTDSNNNPLTGNATIQPPAYAVDQTYGFPKGWSHEVVTTGAEGKLWKSIASVSISYAGSATPEILLIGVPSAAFYGSGGTFVKVGTKVSITSDPKAPMPTAIQDGQDKGAYIKQGEIDVGTFDISCKIPTGADGLARYNGRFVTGWLRELKEDQVNTQNIFLGRMIVTVKMDTTEGAEPNTLKGTGMVEKYAFIMAH